MATAVVQGPPLVEEVMVQAPVVAREVTRVHPVTTAIEEVVRPMVKNQMGYHTVIRETPTIEMAEKSVAVPQVEVREVIQEVPQVVAVEVARQVPNVEHSEVVKNLSKPVYNGYRGGATGAESGADPLSAQAPHPEVPKQIAKPDISVCERTVEVPQVLL